LKRQTSTQQTLKLIRPSVQNYAKKDQCGQISRAFLDVRGGHRADLDEKFYENIKRKIWFAMGDEAQFSHSALSTMLENTFFLPDMCDLSMTKEWLDSQPASVLHWALLQSMTKLNSTVDNAHLYPSQRDCNETLTNNKVSSPQVSQECTKDDYMPTPLLFFGGSSSEYSSITGERVRCHPRERLIEVDAALVDFLECMFTCDYVVDPIVWDGCVFDYKMAQKWFTENKNHPTTRKDSFTYIKVWAWRAALLLLSPSPIKGKLVYHSNPMPDPPWVYLAQKVESCFQGEMIMLFSAQPEPDCTAYLDLETLLTCHITGDPAEYVFSNGTLASKAVGETVDQKEKKDLTHHGKDELIKLRTFAKQKLLKIGKWKENASLVGLGPRLLSVPCWGPEKLAGLYYSDSFDEMCSRAQTISDFGFNWKLLDDAWDGDLKRLDQLKVLRSKLCLPFVQRDGSDLSFMVIGERKFANETLERCNFAFSDFRGTQFDKIVFKECTFIATCFEECVMNDVIFRDCSFSDLNVFQVGHKSTFVILPSFF